MAIGLARMFGVTFPLNFNSPYRAVSVSEFWRRWNITLSGFLRDYLYIPLGGNRHGEARRVFNLMVTMLLGGLWHGAAWRFMLWGGLHGLYLVVHGWWERLGLRLPRLLAWAVTLLAVLLAWVPFRASSFAAAVEFYRGLFGGNGVLLPEIVVRAVPALAHVAQGGAGAAVSRRCANLEPAARGFVFAVGLGAGAAAGAAACDGAAAAQCRDHRQLRLLHAGVVLRAVQHPVRVFPVLTCGG